MKLLEHRSFPIADIQVEKRLREVDAEWAQGLAAMIAETGLQHPVQVMKLGNSYRLIAGAHRLAAFVALGRSDIPAFVYEPETDQPELEIRLQEIVENVGRRELSALDRAAHIAELKETFLKLNGETRGGDRKSEKSKRQTLPFWSLTDELSAKMGLGERTIQADVKLFSGLSGASRKAIAGTWLADNRAQLVALSKHSAQDQKPILDLLFDDSDIKTVGQAEAAHFNKVDTSNPDEKAFAAFMKLWARSSKKVKKQIARYVADEVGA
jgi:ParB family transcriptional regulator, chromosome partitioning protein